MDDEEGTDDDDNDRKEAAVAVAVAVETGEEDDDDDDDDDGDGNDDDDKGRKTSSATLLTSIFDVWEKAIDTSRDVRECHLFVQELERLLQIVKTRKNSLAATTSMRR